MKKLILIFVSVLLLFSCEKEDSTISKDQALEHILDIEGSELITQVIPQEITPYSEIRVELYEYYYYKFTRDGVSTYLNLDSITGLIDGERIEIGYEIEKGDKPFVTIIPKKFFNEGKELELKFYSSWIYSTDPIYNENEEYRNWDVAETKETTLKLKLLNQLRSDEALKEDLQIPQETSIYYVPSFELNYLPDNEFLLQSINDSETKIKYKLIVELNNEKGKVESNINYRGDSIAFLEYDGTLTPNSKYTIKVKTNWYLKEEESENWALCADFLNSELVFEFNTESYVGIDDLIQVEDIDFIYPLDRQFNYLEKEYEKGYFRLRDLELMKRVALAPFDVTIRNVVTKEVYQTTTTYNKDLDILEYPLPASFLENEQVYQVKFYREVRPDKYYEYYFKTSSYNTFLEKWEEFKYSFTNSWKARADYPNVDKSHGLYVQCYNITCNTEGFDLYEVERFLEKNIQPLVQFESTVLQSWQSKVEWQIYSEPSLKFNRYNSLYTKYSYPPLDAIYIVGGEPYSIKLSDSSIGGNIEYPSTPFLSSFRWEVLSLMKYDAIVASWNASDTPEGQRTEWQQLAVDYYPDLPRLEIDIVFSNDKLPPFDILYIIPGIGLKTTRIESFEIN